jgi:hypothetical protein
MWKGNYREKTYGEREAERRAQMRRDRRAEEAYKRLEVGDSVEAPEGWRGTVAEKLPDGMRVVAETWDEGGTYRADELERLDDMGHGVSL